VAGRAPHADLLPAGGLAVNSHGISDESTGALSSIGRSGGARAALITSHKVVGSLLRGGFAQAACERQDARFIGLQR